MKIAGHDFVHKSVASSEALQSILARIVDISNRQSDARLVVSLTKEGHANHLTNPQSPFIFTVVEIVQGDQNNYVLVSSCKRDSSDGRGTQETVVGGTYRQRLDELLLPMLEADNVASLGVNFKRAVDVLLAKHVPASKYQGRRPKKKTV